MAPRPFRFGVNCTTTSVAEWREAARTADALGFDTFIGQDHLSQQLAPLPALVAAAAVTSRLRLATLVLNNDLRHPALVAKEAATLDVLSDGRLEFGLGAGWLTADYTTAGIPMAAPAVRLARLAEAVQLWKLLLSSEQPISFAGTYYQVDQLDPAPRPVQRPRPPLMLGGRQRRMLALAAREADIVGISLLDPRGPEAPPPPSFEQKIAWVREAAGPRLSEIELHVNVGLIHVGDGAEGATAIEQRATRTGQSPAEVAASPGTLVGSVDAIVERLHALREQHGVSYYVVPGRAMAAFAPVIARLATQ